MVYLEYKVISLLWLHDKEEGEGASVNRISGHESALNELGRLGWELVGITHIPDGRRAGIGRNLVTFKRPLRDA